MRISFPPGFRPGRVFAVCAGIALVAIGARLALAGDLGAIFGFSRSDTLEPAELVNVPHEDPLLASVHIDSLTGRSGAVRVTLLTADEVPFVPGLLKRFGSAARSPGIHVVPLAHDTGTFAFITMAPWRSKVGTFIHAYYVGWWPAERRMMPANYENPVGFVEVTPQNEDLQISAHFFLRDFVTHDQVSVWPKYVVLREELLDKLELVLEDLAHQGVSTRNVVVLSGFRTPEYNAKLKFEGAAFASRHQYGDAADIIIDANHDGRMDDLNGDGVVNLMDTDVINRAVERVEHRYPELTGGLGLYSAIGPSGPFAHIDVRGSRARWTNIGRRRASAAGEAMVSGDPHRATPVGTCKAEGASAILCAGFKH